MVEGVVLIMAAIGLGFALGWGFRSLQPAPEAPPHQPVQQPPPDESDPNVLAARLHDLEAVYQPFASNAAHPSALNAHAHFAEATRLLASPAVPLGIVLQYMEGANWGLACAALAALKLRPDHNDAAERVQAHCDKLAPWPMYFALELLAAMEPRGPVGAPLVGARDWWADNPFFPLIFRDYFEQRAKLGDTPSFDLLLYAPNAAPTATIRLLLQRIVHPFAATLLRELDDTLRATDDMHSTSAASQTPSVLSSVGRFWSDQTDDDVLVMPDAWHAALRAAEATLRQPVPRSLLVAGEANVGKSSFLELLAKRAAADGWKVFEASGADLMADQMYIGQLEGRIRSVIEALATGKKLIWYIPDIVQLARSGRHQGQSASMLDQVQPAIAAGKLVIWCEAVPASAARLLQLQPSLRSLLELVMLEPLSADETLTLARNVLAVFASRGTTFRPGCAEVALDCARQYLGTGGLPGSALLMLKLTALRIEDKGKAIEPRQVLETLSQLSGLPVSILDTKERIDLNSIRTFFRARVIGQDEPVEAIVQRIAMLKAGLNDPGKPIAVFLFAGPTGTGKTELAKAAAEFLFGSVERLLRLDMSEFQTPESLGKILGQSTGPMPVETDSLISRVRKQPFSVVLLDEFEKSHPLVWDLFLQLFDEGRLTDAMGQVADFRHCLIILTSNLGATAHRSLGLGFAPQASVFTTEQIMAAIAQTYRPEFQNRLDKVIVFQPLTRELMRGILHKELAALLQRRGLKDRAWAVEWESSALEFLLEKGFSSEMGARPLKRAIDQYVLAPLAAAMVEQRLPEGEQFVFVRSDGKAIQAEFVDPDAELAPDGQSGTTEGALASGLSAMILTPAGTPAYFNGLQAELANVEATLASPAWEALKARLTGVMSAPDFWNHNDRFDTLSRIALMDRVRAAAETAQALRARLARGSHSSKPYSPDLVGRLALQLHLVHQGIADVLEFAPIEVACVVEPVFDRAAERQGAVAWCQRLSGMYHAWADKRRMHLSEITGATADTPLLLISGFGAHRVLAREIGLHVLEASEGSSRITARLVLAAAPLGDMPPARARSLVLKSLELAPRPATLVRRYRDAPPLVRNADGKWRTGRLDLVLGGDFDLMEAGRG